MFQNAGVSVFTEEWCGYGEWTRFGGLLDRTVSWVVEPDELKKWVKKLNKDSFGPEAEKDRRIVPNLNTHYSDEVDVAWRHPLDPYFTVLKRPGGRPFKERDVWKTLLAPTREDGTRGFPVPQIHVLFHSDSLFNEPVTLEKGFAEVFANKWTSARVREGAAKFPVIMFYKDGPEPTGLYVGEWKDGRAHGYGSLIMPFPVNGKPIIADRYDNDRYQYQVLTGIWEKGVFTALDGVLDLIDSVMVKFNPPKAFGHDTRPRYRWALTSAEFGTDPLNDQLNNRGHVDILAWPEDSLPKSEWVLFKILLADFSGDDIGFDYITSDSASLAEVPAWKRWLPGKPVWHMNRSTDVSDETRVNDHLRYWSTRRLVWDSHLCSTHSTYKEQNGNSWLDNSFDVYAYDMYRRYDFRSRPRRDLPWQDAGSYKIVSYEGNCNGGWLRSVPVSLITPDNREFSNYGSWNEAFKDMMERVMEAHPAPPSDTTNSTTDIATRAKSRMIMERASRAAKYAIRAEEPWRGVWYDEVLQRAYMIEGGSATNCQAVLLADKIIFGTLGYMYGIQDLALQIADGTVKVTDAKDRTQSFTGTIDRMTTDAIIFSDGTTWQRIRAR